MIISDKRDQLLQRDRYIVMVPRFGDLPACPAGTTRFLMGEQGLFLETRLAWGGMCMMLWPSPVPQTQFGRVTEYDDFIDVLRDQICPIIESEMVPAAAEQAKAGKEWAGWIMHHEGAFFAYTLDQSATGGSVTRRLPDAHTWPGRLACDVHSHGALPPFFSAQDNRDDAFDVRICVVLGSYRGDENQFDMCIRYIVHGFFFPLISLEKGVITDEAEALCFAGFLDRQ